MANFYDINGNVLSGGSDKESLTSKMVEEKIYNIQWWEIKSSPQICLVFDLTGISVETAKLSYDLLVDDENALSYGCHLRQMDSYGETSIGNAVESETNISVTGGVFKHYEREYTALPTSNFAIVWLTFAPKTDTTFTTPFGVKIKNLDFKVNGETVPLYSYYIMSAYSNGTMVKTTEFVESDLFVPQNRVKEVSENNPWYDKKWIAFGTSITDIGAGTGKYIPYLAEYSGMRCCECGNGGGAITSNGVIYTNITGKDLTGYDLVTVEGFVNDWYQAKTLGTVGDTTVETFCGALYLLLKYIKENSTATIVVITDHHTRANSTYPNWGEFAKNSNQNTQADFWNATKDVCDSLGVPVIEAGANCGISPLNEIHYVDQIHHSDIGGEVFAKYIWSELKDIPPVY